MRRNRSEDEVGKNRREEENRRREEYSIRYNNSNV
jgi:hypothetical protein